MRLSQTAYQKLLTEIGKLGQRCYDDATKLSRSERHSMRVSNVDEIQREVSCESFVSKRRRWLSE